MSVIEIRHDAGSETTCPCFHIDIDGKEYLIIGAIGRGRHVTILTGRWIKDRRALGKTFWSARDLAENYKQHGGVILEYANRLTNWTNPNA